MANYLLAPGQFNDVLRDADAPSSDASYIAAPIGAHPPLAAVVWDRYDEALAERWPSGG